MKPSKGFSLIELLVAVTIVAVLSAIAYGQLERSWAKARDAQRIETVESIGLAVELWYQEYGRDPDCMGGTSIEDPSFARVLPSTETCNEQAELLNFIASVMSEYPEDPLGPGHPDYYYYYDSWHNCYEDVAETDNDPVNIVFAANLESQTTNQYTYCATLSGNHGGYARTSSFGGTKNPSEPYVHVLWQQHD